MRNLIEESLEKFTEEEKLLHKRLEKEDPQFILDYVLKRMKYEEISKEEIEHINTIYERGTTSFEIKAFDKLHRLKLLSQKEKGAIALILDKKFNVAKDGEKLFKDDNNKRWAESEFRIIGTVALALEYIADEEFDKTVGNHFTTPNPTPDQKIEFIENWPVGLIRMLYDRYMDFEERIFNIFQFESVRKK